jgi:hypothetical protein
MAALEIKYGHFVFAPICSALPGILFATLLQPYLFAQSFWNFGFNHYISNTAVCKMEIYNDNKENIKMDEGYQRYMRLHAIVQEINSNPISQTADWYTEHNELLHLYHDHFNSGFAGLHQEITDIAFRANCAKLDILINKLMKEFDSYHWFSVYDYLEFNKTAIAVVDAVFAAIEMSTEDDETINMFAGLSI